MEISVGLVAEVATLVEPEDTALSVGSGDLRVYATPCMVALMEGAACEALNGLLGNDQTTVGTLSFVCHTGRHGGHSKSNCHSRGRKGHNFQRGGI